MPASCRRSSTTRPRWRRRRRRSTRARRRGSWPGLEPPARTSLTAACPRLPSLFHSSCRCRRVGGEERVPFDVVRFDGSDGARTRSRSTRTVPAAVPSLFHSSLPVSAVVGAEVERAADVGELARATSCRGPGMMSLTRTVPAAVPSLFHSSTPSAPSFGREEERAVRRPSGAGGIELAGPGRMSLTRAVPASVPSLFHSSTPVAPSLARKNSVPPTSVQWAGRTSRRRRGGCP